MQGRCESVTTADKRARGRSADPARTARTRALILEAALATFLDRGFEGARMVDVASRAGLAKGTLYLHFADKTALFEFVLRELISEPLSRFRAAPPAPGETPREALERLVLPLLRDLERSGRATVLRLILVEGSRFPELAAIHRRLVIDPVMAAIRMKVQAAVDAGKPELLPLVRFPQLMAAPIVMATVWNGLWSGRDPLDTEAVFSAFLDLVFGPSPAG
jgi:AcrR family transcriptional regulator